MNAGALARLAAMDSNLITEQLFSTGSVLTGIVLYLLLWVIVPNEPEGHA